MLIGIQWLVASTAKDVRNQTPRPQLPNSLVHAFDKLLIYYILTSKQLSLLIQFFGGTKNSQATRDLLEDRQQQLESRHAHVRLDVMDLLSRAKKDVLLRGTEDRDENSLGLESVGACFLTMALVMTMQNGSINLSKEGAEELETQDSAKFIDMDKKYSDQNH